MGINNPGSLANVSGFNTIRQNAVKLDSLYGMLGVPSQPKSLDDYTREALESTWSTYDNDKSGGITRDEFVSRSNDLGASDEPVLDNAFNEFDTNDDTEIDKDEFGAAMNSNVTVDNDVAPPSPPPPSTGLAMG